MGYTSWRTWLVRSEAQGLQQDGRSVGQRYVWPDMHAYVAGLEEETVSVRFNGKLGSPVDVDDVCVKLGL